MLSYVSLDDVRSTKDSLTTTDDEVLKTYCRAALRWIDMSTGRIFYPQYEIKTMPHPQYASELKFDDDLLEVDQLFTNNGDTEISSNSWVLARGADLNLTPYDRIILLPDATNNVFLWSGNAINANLVYAIWGYHQRWSEAWVSTGDTIGNDGGIGSSELVIEVTNADGAAVDGRLPRFQTYDLLKMTNAAGEMEYAIVTSVDSEENLVTVMRGANGTTPASHEAGVVLYSFRPEETIVQAARRLVSYFYAQRDVSTFDVTVIPEFGQMTAPAGVPKDVYQTIRHFRKWSR